MKIVLIGGGSFVFAPTVLADAIIKHRLSECELVLVDPARDIVTAMEGAGHRMAADMGVHIRIHSVAERELALPGADFVLVSVAVQGARRWAMDYEILKEVGTPDQARECGAMGGLMAAFRSITFVMGVCQDMERLCPGAMLLNVTNPLPRVVTAVAKYTTIPVLGFCNIAWGGAEGYEWFARLIGRDTASIQVMTAGLNHFAWLLDIKDTITGEDLYPMVKDRVLKGTGREFKVMQKWLYEYGGIAAGVVDHHGEYLPYDKDIHYPSMPPFHGDENERKQRVKELIDIAEGRMAWQDVLLTHGSWEHPVDVAVALNHRTEVTFDIVNMPNKGYLPQLPEGRIVEVPAFAKDGVITGIKVPVLPEGVAGLCNVISDVNELVAEAAVDGARSLAERAIEMDLAIADKRAAKLALKKMLKAHADLLPQFS